MKEPIEHIEYQTHEAIVTHRGQTFRVPITWDASRAQQNQEIERYFDKLWRSMQLKTSIKP